MTGGGGVVGTSGLLLIGKLKLFQHTTAAAPLLPSLPIDSCEASGAGGGTNADAERAAATLATLAYFAMLRRVGKSLDLQVGHYCWSHRKKEDSAVGVDDDADARTIAQRRSALRGGMRGGGSLGGFRQFGASVARRLTNGVASSRTVGGSSSPPPARSPILTLDMLHDLLPGWLRAYLRSLRWCCVTPPTFLIWYAISIEMRAHCGWQRLLLPTLLFALNECGQTIRLFTLLVVHEGFAIHEHLRLRSAHWLHRLELFAALHWIGLAGAVVLPGDVFGAPPPPTGILLALPCACLVAITCLEQLPGDVSELLVLLRHSARAKAAGDLQHLCSGNSWCAVMPRVENRPSLPPPLLSPSVPFNYSVRLCTSARAVPSLPSDSTSTCHCLALH